jgi:CBS domain-containing protein
MNPPISSMMQRPVYSVTMEDSVAQVESMLSGRHLSWVPVLEPARGEVAGVISASDLVAFHAQGRNPATTRAWQMCSYKPIVVDVEMLASQVAALMVERGVHHVTVTDGRGIAGVVSSLDFVRRFAAATRPELRPASE